MLSIAALRQAATTSARRHAAIQRLSVIAPLRRAYATENDSSESAENKKNESEKTEAEKTQEPVSDADAAKDDHAKALAEKDKKIAELQDAYLRCLADQENIRERSRKEIASSKEFAIQKFAKDLLETVDILGMALTSVPDELRSKPSALKAAMENEKLVDQLCNLYTGVSMTESELVKTLKRHGVESHNPEGETFDPNKHQALFQAPMPDKEAGTVFSVQKIGYTFKGRVLRPAQVGVVAESQ